MPPPSHRLPLWAIYNRMALSGAVVQGEQISPAIAPIAKTPPGEPPWRLLLSSVSRVCSDDGSCSVNRPNMESASSINTADRPTRTYGCCRAAWNCSPAAATTSPSAV